MIIIGIDPGNARCGWGLIRKEPRQISFLSCGCIETKKALGPGRRLLNIANELQRIIKRWRPEAAAIEDIFFFKNVKTVVAVAEARGVAMALLAKLAIPQASYTPLEIKQAVTGYGRADKMQVGAMVMRLLRLPTIPKPDDAVDALASAICHAHTLR